MKKLLISIAALFNVSWTEAQTLPQAQQVFDSVTRKLGSLTRVRYQTYRKIVNPANNYFSENSGSCYFEFDPGAPAQLSRLQFDAENFRAVYNGSEYFKLNGKSKTYTLVKADVKELSNASLMYNSLAVLRIGLPVIGKDTSVVKSIKDTLIDGRSFYALYFQLSSGAIDFPAGVATFPEKIQRYYTIVTDRETFLPYMIFDRNSFNEGYYVMTVFNEISIDPPAPEASSWNLSGYTGYEPQARVIQRPLIAAGTLMPQWSLPEYNGATAKEISSKDYDGRLVIMEFWIKNCGYCMAAFPHLKTLQEKYGKKVQILSINAYEQPKDIEFFYKRESPAYKMLYNGETLANALGIYAYPGTVLLDKKGKVIYASRGFDREAVEEILKKNL